MAALPSFSDKTSALSTDKQKTLEGPRGRSNTNNHSNNTRIWRSWREPWALSGFSQLLSASFETVPWVWMTFLRTAEGGTHFKCFLQSFPPRVFCSKFKSLPPLRTEGGMEGREEGRDETRTKAGKDERQRSRDQQKTV